MKISNEFTVSTPIDRVWAVLTDIEGIAPCMPGAELTGRDGDAYTGSVRVKVGPVVASYSGSARFTEKDDDNYRAVIDASGRATRGAGTAAALITAQLRPDGERTAVGVDTDLKITGRIAQFGSGMIKDVSEKLLGQFVECLEGKLTGTRASEEPPSTPSAGEAGTNASGANAGGMDPLDDAPDLPPSGAATTGHVSDGATASKQDVTPLDLIGASRGAIAKRLLPLLVFMIIIAAVVYFVVT